MPVLVLERQGSVWIFSPGEGADSTVQSIRVQWKDYDKIPDPGGIPEWLVSFGELFGVSGDGFAIEENGVTLWEFGPPEFEENGE